jgi:hypothetical protein
MVCPGPAFGAETGGVYVGVGVGAGVEAGGVYVGIYELLPIAVVAVPLVNLVVDKP